MNIDELEKAIIELQNLPKTKAFIIKPNGGGYTLYEIEPEEVKYALGAVNIMRKYPPPGYRSLDLLEE